MPDFAYLAMKIIGDFLVHLVNFEAKIYLCFFAVNNIITIN